jgi:predicted RNA binding protein YcfA (HicA-like mRNA interferase family)
VGSVPVLKPREVVSLLEAHGFVEVRQRGSHKQLRHADGRTTTPQVSVNVIRHAPSAER